MQRYFIKQEININQEIYLEPQQIKHIYKVMRFNKGDKIIIVDNNYNSYISEIIDSSIGLVKTVSRISTSNELDIDITLVYALPKGDKFELVLQKSTELGVKHIVPLFSNRCVVKTTVDKFIKKYERYNKIITEASEQSQRSFVPTIEKPINIKELSNYLCDINLVAYEEASKKGEKSNLYNALNSKYQSIMVIVGPEGGFDESEVEYMKSIGIKECSLGKRILRSETAPIYLLSVIAYTRELN